MATRRAVEVSETASGVFVTGLEEYSRHFQQVFWQELEREMRWRALPRLRQRTPTRSGRMAKGWGITRGREGRITATNKQPYAHAVQFSERNRGRTKGARTGRELVRKVGREVLREAIAAAYNRAIILTTTR